VLRAVEPVQLLGAERRLDEQRRSSHKTKGRERVARATQ
jgi:hypothetical protein